MRWPGCCAAMRGSSIWHCKRARLQGWYSFRALIQMWEAGGHAVDGCSDLWILGGVGVQRSL
jgi:hypothetical protein